TAILSLVIMIYVLSGGLGALISFILGFIVRFIVTSLGGLFISGTLENIPSRLQADLIMNFVKQIINSTTQEQELLDFAIPMFTTILSALFSLLAIPLSPDVSGTLHTIYGITCALLALILGVFIGQRWLGNLFSVIIGCAGVVFSFLSLTSSTSGPAIILSCVALGVSIVGASYAVYRFLEVSVGGTIICSV
ncbi:MAG: hypothetical protein ACP5JR_07530, partial [Thermoplasmata archaeon]